MIQLGIRRSGNHAISQWFFPMLGDFVYLNLNDDIGKLNSKDIVLNGKFNSLITFENISLSAFEGYTKEEGSKFLVMRNPLNILASTWVTYNKDKSRIEEAIKLIREYINFRYYVIIYDKWVSSLEYRKNIATHFNLNFDDKNFSRVWGYGESAFKDKKYLDRHSEIKDEEFWNMFNISEMEELWNQYKRKS